MVVKFRDERLILALTEPHKPEIPQTLKKLKVAFDEAIFAHTVSNDLSDVDPSKYQLAVLYSPSDVNALVERFGSDPGKLPMIATFGDGTTRRALDKGLTVSVMAPTPEAPSMSRALEIFIADHNTGRPGREIVVADDRTAEEFIKAHNIKELRRNKAKKAVAAAAKK